MAALTPTGHMATIEKLPGGRVCGDCAHIRRCLSLGYRDNLDSVYCDFTPSRASYDKIVQTLSVQTRERIGDT